MAHGSQPYIHLIVGVDAKDPADRIEPTGTGAQQNLWRGRNATIRRSDPIVSAMRVALGCDEYLIHQVFIAGTTIDP